MFSTTGKELVRYAAAGELLSHFVSDKFDKLKLAAIVSRKPPSIVVPRGHILAIIENLHFHAS